MKKLREFMRRDGWLYLMLVAAVAACLLLKNAGTPDAVTQEEARLARVLSQVEGAGKVEVAVFYPREEDAAPCGVVVVAQGAEDVAVQLRLRRAVTTLTGVDVSHVDIFLRREEP